MPSECVSAAILLTKVWFIKKTSWAKENCANRIQLQNHFHVLIALHTTLLTNKELEYL